MKYQLQPIGSSPGGSTATYEASSDSASNNLSLSAIEIHLILDGSSPKLLLEPLIFQPICRQEGDKKIFYIEFNELNMYEESHSITELKRQIFETLSFIYKIYAIADDSQLTSGAKEIADFIRARLI